MTEHELKTWPNYFWDIENGRKNFEVRYNDRDFKVGDVLKLMEYKPVHGVYTSRMLYRKISYILPGGAFGIEKGYCVLGLEI